MRFACFIALLCSPVAAADGKLPPAAKTRIDFDKHIRPLLKTHCAKCHAGETRKGGFSINTRKTILDGSESETVVVVGNSAKSLLIGRVAETDPDLRMPPKGEKPLTKTEIGLLRAWIDQGLKWKDGFSFGTLHRQAELSPRKVTLPKVPGVTHPIDRLLASEPRDFRKSLGSCAAEGARRSRFPASGSRAATSGRGAVAASAGRRGR